jgi:hypothetical protein
MEKKLRLRHLVNKELSFYPKKTIDREIINKYDSDEENQIEYDSEIEDKAIGSKSSTKRQEEGKKEEPVNGTSKFKEDEDYKEKSLEDLKSQARSEKSGVGPKTITFECKEDEYVDSELAERVVKIFTQEDYDSFKKLFGDKLFAEKLTLKTAAFYSRIFRLYLKLSDNFLENSQSNIGIKVLLTLNTFLCEEKSKINNKEFVNMYNGIFSLSDELISIGIKTSHSVLEVIPVTINLLKLLIISEENESLYKSTITNLNKVKEKAYISKDQCKDLLTICFNLLKKKCLSNIFLQLTEIICFILKHNNDYFTKFVEIMASSFNDFTEEYSINNDKIYQIDKKILRNYYNYYSLYTCHNSETISLYSLLFMKSFGILYYYEQTSTEEVNNTNTSGQGNANNNKSENSFNRIFELFFSKILESKRDSLLLCLYCLISDLLKVRYNLEFPICLVLLTNIFLYLSQLANQEEIELPRRKYFMNCYALILEEFLSDFKNMKKYHICYSPNQACGNCFSCRYTNEEVLQNRLYFTCTKCNANTNLKIQIITESSEKDISVCSFCDIKTLFNEYPTLLNNDNEITISSYDLKEGTQTNDLFDNFLRFQDALYKNCFLFLRSYILHYFKEIGRNEIYSESLSESFNIFLKIFISDSKVNFNEFYFTQIKQFFEIQKYKLINLIPDIYIDENLISYFYFYYFYINFLFVGSIRLTELLTDDSVNWNIRYKSLKLLEKFLTFEGKENIFKHFNIDIVSSLLSDHSFHIREYSLEILLKFYKFGKIERNQLLCILYENINETSFLIRKRIIKALIDLVYTDDINNVDILELCLDESKKIEIEHFRNVNFIFLNKLLDNSESEKIKSMIIEYYFNIFNNCKKYNNLTTNTLVTFIKLLTDNQDYQLSSHYLENIATIFEKVNLYLI